AVEPHLTTEDGAVGAEVLLPEIVAEHDDSIALGDLVLLGSKVAPELRLHAHDLEEVPADQHAESQLRDAVGLRRKADGAVVERHEAVERLASIADVHVIAVRRGQVAAQSLE